MIRVVSFNENIYIHGLYYRHIIWHDGGGFLEFYIHSQYGTFLYTLYANDLVPARWYKLASTYNFINGFDDVFSVCLDLRKELIYNSIIFTSNSYEEILNFLQEME